MWERAAWAVGGPGKTRLTSTEASWSGPGEHAAEAATREAYHSA